MDDIKQDITEICYDITDYGEFEIGFHCRENLIHQIFIRAHSRFYCDGPKPFNFNEIKEVCLRIKDYIGNKYAEFSFRTAAENNWEGREGKEGKEGKGI